MNDVLYVNIWLLLILRSIRGVFHLVLVVVVACLIWVHDGWLAAALP